MEKKVYEWDDGDWEEAPTIWRRYVWYNWLMMQELDISDGGSTKTVRRHYTWGLDLTGQAGSINSLETAGGIGGLLATHDPNDPEDGSDPYGDFLYFYDANGNAGQLLSATADPNSAAVMAAKYEYDAYGNVTAQSGSYADENPIRFSTKYWDDETGFGYWGYRYYSATLGRWIGRDPLGIGGGWHDLCFVRNRAITLFDATGLFPCERVIDNAPAGTAGGAFMWLGDWWLGFAYVTSVTVGSGSALSASPADTWEAVWYRPFAELFKCCTPSGVQYLWSGVNYATTMTSGRVSGQGGRQVLVFHVSGGVPVAGTPINVPVVSAVFTTPTQEAKNELLRLARELPPTGTAAITWPWPLVGPTGMTKFVKHISCDPKGLTGWPGTPAANTPPTPPPPPPASAP